jgi:PAS domain S-box-containing protein
MNLALTPYLFTLFLSVAITWFLAFYTWRRRQMMAAVPFAITMFFAGVWAMFYALELIAISLPEKLFWFNLKQLGASALGPSLLLFALQYTNQQVKYPKLLGLLLLLEPIGSQLIFWTNSAHGLGGNPHIVLDVLPFPLLVFEFGSWFWFSIFVGYLLFTVTVMIFLTQLPSANMIYRKQINLVLIGLLLPWVGGVLSLFGVWKLDVLDVTPFLFPISGLFLALSLFRYKLLGLTPVAYSAVLSSIRDGIIILNDDFHILELNPAALRLLGRKERSLIGCHLSDVLPIWDDMITNNTQFASGQTVEFYYEQGGQCRYLEAHSADVVNKIHVASGHVLILYDITDRRLAEKARQFSEDRYRTIFETDSAATVILEADMTISLANEGFVKLSGYARHEVEGKKRWTAFVHADDLAQMETYHRERRQVNSKVPYQYEFRLLTRNGRLRNVFVSVALVPGTTTSIASLLDITDRKLAEELLEQRATELEVEVRSEQERSAIILQNVKDAIAVTNLTFEIIYVNKAFSALTGYSEEYALGKQVQFCVHGRIPEQILNVFQQTIKEKIYEVYWEGELPLLRKNGTVYDAAILIAAMRDGNGQLIGYMFSHRDITQSKRLEEARRQFISNVSHQLRTPVTNIKLYADLLQRHFDTPRKEQYFTVLNKQIDRLETIIQNILEFSHLEDRQQKRQWQPLKWKRISQDLQSQLQTLATDKAIKLQFRHESADLAPYYGDPQQIFQIMHELILNAITFISPGGEILVSGETQIEDSQKWLTISVSDNGPGIPVVEQSHIFDRFYRGKVVEAGQIPGTGLGLSTANLIAQAHNGRITVKSDLGQGSTFTLWLPIN